MLGGGDGASGDDLAVLGEAANAYQGGAVRGRGGELHQDGRVRRALEVDEVPPRGGVMRLHALQGVGEEGLPLEIDLALIGDDGPLGGAPWPEGVAHRTPGVLQIRAV